VPLNEIVLGEADALLATAIWPLKLEAMLGVNVIEMLQVPDGATLLEHVLAAEKLAALAPPSVMPLIFSGAVPLLVTVTVCAAEVDSAAAVKLSELALRVIAGVAGKAPVPVSEITCGEPAALSITSTAAAKLPLAAGVKVTDIEHDAAGARLAPQLFVSAKTAAFAPAIVIPLIESAAVPVLVSVML
jgi:hypothetical protein